MADFILNNFLLEDLKTDKDVVKESKAYFGWAERSNAEIIDDCYASFPLPVALGCRVMVMVYTKKTINL
jgi:hypothetical protein